MTHHGLDLDAGVEAPGAARRALACWLAEDGVTGLDERVLLVASELVTIAAVHAGTALQLSDTADGWSVGIGVRDGARSALRLPPAPTVDAFVEDGPHLLAVGGRGLSIVRALADEWGMMDVPDGKRVWPGGRGAPRTGLAMNVGYPVGLQPR